MPVIMPMWIADNRIVTKPVGAVVAPKPVGLLNLGVGAGARNALLSQ